MSSGDGLADDAFDSCDPSLGDDTARAAVKCQWHQVAQEHWEEHTQKDRTKVPQATRIKALQWLWVTHTMHFACLGKGWEKFRNLDIHKLGFCEEPEQDHNYLQDPSVTLAVDQGSDGW